MLAYKEPWVWYAGVYITEKRDGNLLIGHTICGWLIKSYKNCTIKMNVCVYIGCTPQSIESVTT